MRGKKEVSKPGTPGVAVEPSGDVVDTNGLEPVLSIMVFDVLLPTCTDNGLSVKMAYSCSLTWIDSE